MSTDPYDVILADPPWSFITWSDEGKGRSPERHYPVMSTEDICRLSLPPLADNAALFLWSTWTHLPDALRVMEGWGFSYRTEAWVWVKAKRSGFGFFTGMGYYTRSNTEPCLLGVRGSMPVARHDIQGLIYEPVHGHSKKPNAQYRKIEALYPGRRYLELFARRKREGWHSWGNEVDSDVKVVIR